MMCKKNSIRIDRLRKLIDKIPSRQIIADELGCDKSTIAKHYNGNRTVTTDYLVKYAKYFNVTTDYLLGLANSKEGTAFYPSEDEITPYGIFKAINYLLVAYGEENIISPEKLQIKDDAVCKYLNNFKKIKLVKKCLSNIGRSDIFSEIVVKGLADIDNLEYDKETRILKTKVSNEEVKIKEGEKNGRAKENAMQKNIEICETPRQHNE